MKAGEAISSTIVAELLVVAFNSILFQRALYSRVEFRRARKWGLPVMVTSNHGVSTYLITVVRQICDMWLKKPCAGPRLDEIALIILDADEKPVERWQFHLQPVPLLREAADLDVTNDLRRVLRQIGATVSFLPVLKGTHSFRIAISEELNGELNGEQPGRCPEDWTETHYRDVRNAENGEFHAVSLSDLVVQLKVLYTLD